MTLTLTPAEAERLRFDLDMLGLVDTVAGNVRWRLVHMKPYGTSRHHTLHLSPRQVPLSAGERFTCGDHVIEVK